MAKNIWQVLKINDMTFHLKQREDLRQRLVDMSIRDRSSPRAVYTPDDGLGSEDYISDSGGAGVYSSAPDYFKVVLAVLQNDERLLKKATVDEMFKPQLSEQSLASLTETLAKPEFGAPLGGLPAQVKKNHSLAGMLPMDDLPGSWRKGTLTWGGMPNLTWVSVFSFYGKASLTNRSSSTGRAIFVVCMLLKYFHLENPSPWR